VEGHRCRRDLKTCRVEQIKLVDGDREKEYRREVHRGEGKEKMLKTRQD